MRRDLADQMRETLDYHNYLSIARDRVARLESAIGALIHAEAFVASHGLQPIMTDFIREPFSIRRYSDSMKYKYYKQTKAMSKKKVKYRLRPFLG